MLGVGASPSIVLLYENKAGCGVLMTFREVIGVLQFGGMKERCKC